MTNPDKQNNNRKGKNRSGYQSRDRKLHNQSKKRKDNLALQKNKQALDTIGRDVVKTNEIVKEIHVQIELFKEAVKAPVLNYLEMQAIIKKIVEINNEYLNDDFFKLPVGKMLREDIQEIDNFDGIGSATDGVGAKIKQDLAQNYEEYLPYTKGTTPPDFQEAYTKLFSDYKKNVLTINLRKNPDDALSQINQDYQQSVARLKGHEAHKEYVTDQEITAQQLAFTEKYDQMEDFPVLQEKMLQLFADHKENLLAMDSASQSDAVVKMNENFKLSLDLLEAEIEAEKTHQIVLNKTVEMVIASEFKALTESPEYIESPELQSKLLQVFEEFKKNLGNNMSIDQDEDEANRAYKNLSLEYKNALHLYTSERGSNYLSQRKAFLESYADYPHESELQEKMKDLFTEYYEQPGKEALSIEDLNKAYKDDLTKVLKDEKEYLPYNTDTTSPDFQMTYAQLFSDYKKNIWTINLNQNLDNALLQINQDYQQSVALLKEKEADKEIAAQQLAFTKKYDQMENFPVLQEKMLQLFSDHKKNLLAMDSASQPDAIIKMKENFKLSLDLLEAEIEAEKTYQIAFNKTVETEIASKFKALTELPEYEGSSELQLKLLQVFEEFKNNLGNMSRDEDEANLAYEDLIQKYENALHLYTSERGSNYLSQRKAFLESYADYPHKPKLQERMEALFAEYYEQPGKEALSIEDLNKEYDERLTEAFKDENVQKELPWEVVRKGAKPNAFKPKEVKVKEEKDANKQLQAAIKDIKEELRSIPTPGPKSSQKDRKEAIERNKIKKLEKAASEASSSSSVSEPNQDVNTSSTSSTTKADAELAKQKRNKTYFELSEKLLKEVANNTDKKIAALDLINKYLSVGPKGEVEKKAEAVIALASKMKNGVEASKILLLTLQLLIEPKNETKMASYKKLAEETAKNKPNSTWAQAICAAMLALSVALIAVGALMFAGTIAAVPAVAGTLIGAGSASLFANGFCLFKIRKDTNLNNKNADELNEGMNNLATSMRSGG